MIDIRPGTLYVVATPIGNRDDITLRALNILREVDLIAAEDTRKTMSIALVSNAGTPTVSDPGYRLITATLADDLNVMPIPGVSAATAALSVAGLPTDSFVFLGFPARKKTKRLQQLNDLASEPRTLIFYESPRRILTLLGEIRDAMGDRYLVLAREMTKIHEEFLRGRLSEIATQLKGRANIKGECTLLVAGCDSGSSISWDTIRAEIRNSLAAEGKHVSQKANMFLKWSGISLKSTSFLKIKYMKKR
jgi:16S rRNA (cytidine1402-2'-O)-methyltransferase